MTITENQRRTLDLMAESAGWNWADVEALSQELFGECVAGLSEAQARKLGNEIPLGEMTIRDVVHMVLRSGDDAPAT